MQHLNIQHSSRCFGSSSRRPRPFGAHGRGAAAPSRLVNALPRAVDHACTQMQREECSPSQPALHQGLGAASIMQPMVESRQVPTLLPQLPLGLGLMCMGAAAALCGAPAAEAASPFAQLAQAITSVRIPGLVGDSQFTEGLLSGFLLIFFSEIGDKTFFIALLLALKEDRGTVFAGTFGALAVMSVISVALGEVFHQLDHLLPASSIPLDDLLAVALLLYFGLTTLKGAAEADSKAAEEKEEADSVVAGMSGGSSALVLSTFSLVFAAEWGDKSFLATIALAAASDPAGVVVGAIMGHGLATGIAVAGGSLLSKYIDERTAQYIGGSLFLVFAASTIFDIVTGAHGG